VIKFLTLEGIPCKEIHQKLIGVYGDNAPCYATVKNWRQETSSGRVSLGDAPRSGRPAEVCEKNVVDKVKSIIEDDRRVRIRQIVELTGVSYGYVHKIMHEELGLSKICARWVPRRLTDE